MTVLVVVEALAIGLLGVLVVGLLRSHAEIIRELHRLGVDVGGAASDHEAPAPMPVSLQAGRRSPSGTMLHSPSGLKAADLSGTSPTQESVHVGVAGARHDTLLAFLSSGCHTCSALWQSLRDPASIALPDGTRLIVVTKSPAEESLSRIRELAPDGAAVVMSTQAWRDYGVPVTPYFVHVDGPSGAIVGQGSGTTWSQVISLLRQAEADDGVARRAGRGLETETAVDQRLLAAGIRPGDASLYAPSPPEGN